MLLDSWGLFAACVVIVLVAIRVAIERIKKVHPKELNPYILGPAKVALQDNAVWWLLQVQK